MTITSLPSAPAVTDQPATFNTKAFNFVAALPTLVTEINAKIALNDITAAAEVHALASKATPVDADELPLLDSATTFSLKRLTWVNLKATLEAWLNSLTATWSNKTLVAPALGTPASGVVTNLTGTASININGTVGATTPSTVAATTVTATTTSAAPPSSGSTSTAIARLRGSNAVELNTGSAMASPFGMWLQATDSTNFANNFPITLNPNGGNVGIGIADPGAYKLYVNGTVIASGVITATAGIAVEAVIAPTMTNGWGAGAKYWKDAFGVVHLQGSMTAGGAGGAFTLPAGYRPAVASYFPCGTGAAASVSRLDISTAGVVEPWTLAVTNLDGISFRTT